MNYTLDVNKPKASSTPFAISRRPYPVFSNTYETRTDGSWRYDSAVASAERHLGPVMLSGSFTFANNISNYANTFDPYNVTDHWTRDNADRRMYATAYAETPLPFGKGQRLLSTTGPLINRIVSNWKIAAIPTLASGQYYSPLFTGPDPANASQGFVTQLPDCVGNPNTGALTRNLWFNPAAFAIPSPSAGRYGTCGMNTLKGYPIHVVHAAISKTFPFGEQIKVVFTAQVSNVFNTPEFTIPNNNLSTPNPGMFSAASIAPNSTPEHLGSRQMDLKLRVQW
jgi:hypothetical protein